LNHKISDRRLLPLLSLFLQQVNFLPQLLAMLQRKE
jgi:hypothetical protein